MTVATEYKVSPEAVMHRPQAGFISPAVPAILIGLSQPQEFYTPPFRKVKQYARHFQSRGMLQNGLMVYARIAPLANIFPFPLVP